MILSLPFDGQYTITQKFGVNGPQFGLPGHNGIDYATPTGTPILAAAAGYVSEVFSDPKGYGLYVKVMHSNHYTLYAHLSHISVKLGEAVVTGDPLGLSGNTGNSSGPHLHWGFRTLTNPLSDPWNGWVDPADYLAINDVDDVPDTVPVEIDPAGFGRVVCDIPLSVRQGVGVHNTRVGSLPAGVTIGYYGLIDDGDDLWLDLDGIIVRAQRPGLRPDDSVPLRLGGRRA